MSLEAVHGLSQGMQLVKQLSRLHAYAERAKGKVPQCPHSEVTHLKLTHCVIGSFSHVVLPAMQRNTGLENEVPEEKRRGGEGEGKRVIQWYYKVENMLTSAGTGKRIWLSKHAHHPKLSNQKTTTTVDNTGCQGWSNGIQDFDFAKSMKIF